MPASTDKNRKDRGRNNAHGESDKSGRSSSANTSGRAAASAAPAAAAKSSKSNTSAPASTATALAPPKIEPVASAWGAPKAASRPAVDNNQNQVPNTASQISVSISTGSAWGSSKLTLAEKFKQASLEEEKKISSSSAPVSNVEEVNSSID